MSDPFTSREFKSDGNWTGPPEFAMYCPVKGARMKFLNIPVKNAANGFPKTYYKALIIDAPGPVEAKPRIESIIFLPKSETELVATTCEALHGMLMNETIVAVLDAQKNVTEVRHEFTFFNGQQGLWTCR